MKPVFPNKEIEDEDRRIFQMLVASGEDITIEEAIDRYGSPEYKSYIAEYEKEKKRLWEEEGTRI